MQYNGLGLIVTNGLHIKIKKKLKKECNRMQFHINKY